MKYIKTYEGLFDIFKKKDSIVNKENVDLIVNSTLKFFGSLLPKHGTCYLIHNVSILTSRFFQVPAKINLNGRLLPSRIAQNISRIGLVAWQDFKETIMHNDYKNLQKFMEDPELYKATKNYNL
jgi:hypothetical protein